MTMEYNGILSERGHEAANWRAFAGALLAHSEPWDDLRCRSLTAAQRPHASAAFAALHVEVERVVSSWALPLAPEQTTDDLLLPVLRKKTRQQMKQTIREFDSVGPVSLELAGTRERALEFFDAMEELHTARWERVGRAGSFSNSLWRAFHRTIISDGFDRGDVMISRASCAGEAVGFVYGFRWRERLYALQTGFKPQERPALRSGYLTHLRTMQAVAARGIRHYDLLPDESTSYKRLLAEADGEFTTLTFQHPRLRFRILRIARHLVARMKQLRRVPPAPPTRTSPETDP
jgi:CelD/BcsL family acetyltransferase involved in cellulose biosynthesis